MRIYKMTATFGKLEHQTLTLKPGLNIIEAPNEWGKSTWCAFLVAMLYGLDTRAKTTKNALADKERYAPWSGAPMEGRIDLNWKGRDITIERRSKRRVPLGEFKAYETESGLPVAELTASNCGQLLLGVEQSVFRRAGFIRHADLPVTQDEALRRRLNALVTTGDESSAADHLAETLKELKNRCRYNRTGLLPQEESERSQLEAKLAELDSMEAQCRNLKLRIEELKDRIGLLQNHRDTLEYEAFQDTARQAAQARDALEAAEAELRRQEEICAGLPSLEEARQTQLHLRTFREQWDSLQKELEELPPMPVKPEAPEPFRGMDVELAKAEVKRDAETYAEMSKTAIPKVLIFMGIVGLTAVGMLVFLRAYLFAAIAGAGALAALVWGILESRSVKQKTLALAEKYGSRDYKHWGAALTEYERGFRIYRMELEEYQDAAARARTKQALLLEQKEKLCPDRDADAALVYWNQIAENWLLCEKTRREVMDAENRCDALRVLIKPVNRPSQPDNLTHSREDTARLLLECQAELQQLQNRLGQYQGRMETLGDRQDLQSRLTRKHKRISHLEQNYAALLVAQETLAQARAELQRRFAPRITRRAQELLSQMTGGRYPAMTMGEDLSIQARTEDEDTLHDAIWRSDGTMDQLYLALRLAVAEELTPEAPLVLDDALVRFDDKRMKAAVDILEEMATDKQVILFTCQGREKTA